MFINLGNPSPKSAPSVYPSRIKFGFSRFIELEAPRALNAKFSEVLEARRSADSLIAADLDDVSSVLAHSCRPRCATNSSARRMWESRPSPSAGGTHSIDLLLLNLSQFPDAVWQYDPWSHGIGEISLFGPTHARRLIKIALDVFDQPEAVVVWFVGQPHILSAFYENPESLLWRDAGALLSTLYLVIGALGLKCRALGPSGSPVVEDVLGPSLVGLGGLLFGK